MMRWLQVLALTSCLLACGDEANGEPPENSMPPVEATCPGIRTALCKFGETCQDANNEFTYSFPGGIATITYSSLAQCNALPPVGSDCSAHTTAELQACANRIPELQCNAGLIDLPSECAVLNQ